MATTVAVGSVSVTTSGQAANDLLQKIASITSAVTAVTVPATTVAGTAAAPVTLPAPSGGGTQVLTIPAADTGVISIPTGYTVVMYGGTGSLVGADSTSAVIGTNGPLNYSGGAGTVLATGSVTGVGTINDTTAGAAIVVANGDGENIADTVSGQSFAFESGRSTLAATASVGSGRDYSVSVDGAASVLAFVQGASDYMQKAGAATVVALAGGNTVSQTGGNLFYVAGAGDSISLGGAGSNDLIQSSATVAASIMGGAGADTIIATSAFYQGNSASTASSFMVGGTGTSTVYTAANETMFGGTGGNVVSVASGSNLLYLGSGGADSISGGDSKAKATVWGASNDTITSSASVGSAVYIVNGDKLAIDLTNSGGHNSLLALDGGVFAGNATLTMSNAGNDGIAMFSADAFSLSHVTHTLTIANWQSTDILDLSPLGAGGTGYSASVVAAAQSSLQSGNSFTLPDGTTVVFQGAKPTTIANV